MAVWGFLLGEPADSYAAADLGRRAAAATVSRLRGHSGVCSEVIDVAAREHRGPPRM